MPLDSLSAVGSTSDNFIKSEYETNNKYAGREARSCLEPLLCHTITRILKIQASPMTMVSLTIRGTSCRIYWAEGRNCFRRSWAEPRASPLREVALVKESECLLVVHSARLRAELDPALARHWEKLRVAPLRSSFARRRR